METTAITKPDVTAWRRYAVVRTAGPKTVCPHLLLTVMLKLLTLDRPAPLGLVKPVAPTV